MGLNFNGTEIENVNFNGVEVNKVVFNGTTVWEKQSTITSARFFTFEGNACTGYVGDNSAELIIVPRSYSIDAEGNFVDGEDYNVTSVTINSAERGGFDEYTGNIILQDNISSIGKQAFMFSKLKSVIIGENVTTIGESAFASCENLETITIPTSVTSIETFAFGFGFSSKLKEINVSDDNVNFRTSEDKRCLVDSNGAIIAFASAGIDSYVIPNSIYAIGDWTFTNMKLTTIKIPDSVTSIGEYAFYNCSNLQSFTIPRGVTSIGFSSLTNLTLTQITIEAITPPTLSSNGSISSSITTIYIPTGTLEAYQTADVWKDLNVQFIEKEMWRVVYENSTGEEFYTISSTPVVKEFYVPSVFRTRRTRISGKGHSYNAFNKITFDNIELNTTNYTFVVTDYPLASKGAPQFAMIGAFDERINVKVQAAVNSFGNYVTAGIEINKVEQYY